MPTCVIDMIAVNGQYTFLAMVMNTACTAPPPDHKPALPEFPH